MGAFAPAALIVPSTQATPTSRACGEAAYSYAGIAGRQAADGIVTTLELRALPEVKSGHVAAWVGVGGTGLGPGGTDAWLQVGLAATPSAGTTLYYEAKNPGRQARFVPIGRGILVGERHRVGVIEMSSRPNWWRVWLDGMPVTSPTLFPSSHGRWAPVATSESWNGGATSCNAFAYRFTNIRIVTTRAPWHSLVDAYAIEDPGYTVRRLSGASLMARGGSSLPAAAPGLPTTPVAARPL